MRTLLEAPLTPVPMWIPLPLLWHKLIGTALDDIDVPLHYCSLFASINDALHHHLFLLAPSTHVCALVCCPLGCLVLGIGWMRSLFPVLDLHFEDQKFHCCLPYWLEVSLCSHHYTCTEYCDTADLCRDHQVGCGSNGDHISWSNSIHDAIFSTAQSVAIAPSKETLSFVPNLLARPADIFLTEAAVAQLLLMYMSSPLSTSKHLERLLPPPVLSLC